MGPSKESTTAIKRHRVSISILRNSTPYAIKSNYIWKHLFCVCNRIQHHNDTCHRPSWQHASSQFHQMKMHSPIHNTCKRCDSKSHMQKISMIRWFVPLNRLHRPNRQTEHIKLSDSSIKLNKFTEIEIWYAIIVRIVIKNTKKKNKNKFLKLHVETQTPFT